MTQLNLSTDDSIKLQIVVQRLRDIFARDKVNPVERGAYTYVVRSVVEALRLNHLFYSVGNSPFNPPSDESETVCWRIEINDEIKDLYSLVEGLEVAAGCGGGMRGED